MKLTGIYGDRFDFVSSGVEDEMIEAKKNYQDYFKNYHEAYAVIKEEFDELWDEIRKKEHNKEAIRKEAIQTAAMLYRLIIELT